MSGILGGHFSDMASSQGGGCVPTAHSAYLKAYLHKGRPGLTQKRGSISVVTSVPVAIGTMRDDKFPLHSLVLTREDLYLEGILMN